MSEFDRINIYSELGGSALEAYVKIRHSAIECIKPGALDAVDFDLLIQIELKIEAKKLLTEGEKAKLALLLDVENLRTDDI